MSQRLLGLLMSVAITAELLWSDRGDHGTWKQAFTQQVFYSTKPYNLPTSTFKVTVTFPKWLSAKQVYVYNPPWLQTVPDNSSVLALLIIALESFPLYHVIFGAGFPWIGQEIDTGQFSWDTSSVWFPSITNGGTEREKNNCWLVQLVQCYIHYNLFDIKNMPNREHYVSLLFCSSDAMGPLWLNLYSFFQHLECRFWLQYCRTAWNSFNHSYKTSPLR